MFCVISGKFGNYIPSKLGSNEEAFLGEYGISRSNIIKTVKSTVEKQEEDKSVIDTNVPWSEETTPDLLFWVPNLNYCYVCAQWCFFQAEN